MTPNSEIASVSKKMLWAGYLVSAAPTLMLTFSGIMKFMPPNEDIVKGFEHLGWPLNLAVALGILELACIALYVIPRTAVLGAILLTGYMGGAIATHVRVGDAFVFQAILGVLIWGGLWLREPRLRALIPVRS